MKLLSAFLFEYSVAQKVFQGFQGCGSCSISGEVHFTCDSEEILQECLKIWVDNFLLDNGCYLSPDHAHHDCEHDLGCAVDEDKHTFQQSCHTADPTNPIFQPDCPPGWIQAIAVANGVSNFICYPKPVTTTLSTTIHSTTLQSTTMQSNTMQSTTPVTTLTPFEHIGSEGCPEGFMLEHNNGSLFFDCPNTAGCGTACDQDGNCETTCSSAESSCQDAIASGNLTGAIGTCFSWGCVLSDDSTYREWCVPMTCPVGQVEVCECKATTEAPPVDDGLSAANCAGKVDYKMRSGKAKVSRSGENSNLVRLQQAKVKETKAHTGFVSFPKSACGKDFLAGLKDGRVTVDFADKKATYSVIGSYYADNTGDTQVVIQYNSVPLNVADDKCPKCLGNTSTDQLEMLVMGTKSVEWGSKTAKSCLNNVLVGHAGAAGAPTLLENDESGCVAWTNAL